MGTRCRSKTLESEKMELSKMFSHGIKVEHTHTPNIGTMERVWEEKCFSHCIYANYT